MINALDGFADAAMEFYDDANRDDLVQARASLLRQAVKSTTTELPRKRPSGSMPGWGVVCDVAGEQGGSSASSKSRVGVHSAMTRYVKLRAEALLDDDLATQLGASYQAGWSLHAAFLEFG